MKKGCALLLALAMLLSLTACSLTFLNRYEGEDPPEEKKEDPPAAVEPQEPAIPQEPAEPDVPAEPEAPSAPDQGAEPDGPEAGGDSDERTIRVSHEDVTLFSAGETFRFTVWDSNGADPDACTYTSADPAVASVDEGGGEVTAVAPGTTTITAHVKYGEEEQDLACIVRCRWTEEEPALPDDGGAAAATLTGFYTTLQNQYDGLGAMMVIEGELLENYYPGLSAIAAVEEIYIQETMITMANVAVGLVKLSDSATQEDITAVQNVFQNRITTQADGGAWYPMSCETWEQGVITSTSNVVGMFVYPDEAQAMADLFTETFGS